MKNIQLKAETEKIEAILSGREERFELEKRLLEKYRIPMVVATVNYPGPDKLNKTVDYIFAEMLQTLTSLSYVHSISGINGAGPYFIGLFRKDAEEIKKETVFIESEHRLGRLFDLDVIDFPYRKLSRADFKLENRRCLICDNDHYTCPRENLHSYEELMSAIRVMTEE